MGIDAVVAVSAEAPIALAAVARSDSKLKEAFPACPATTAGVGCCPATPDKDGL